MDRDQQKLGRKLALPEMLVLLVSKFVWPTKNREELWLGICVLLTSPKNGSLSGFFVPITRAQLPFFCARPGGFHQKSGFARLIVFLVLTSHDQLAWSRIPFKFTPKRHGSFSSTNLDYLLPRGMGAIPSQSSSISIHGPNHGLRLRPEGCRGTLARKSIDLQLVLSGHSQLRYLR